MINDFVNLFTRSVTLILIDNKIDNDFLNNLILNKCNTKQKNIIFE